MQEINLLQNKLKDKTDHWDKNNRLIMIVLSLLLIVVLVAAGAFYMLAKSAEESKLAMDKSNAEIQTRLNQMESQMTLAKGFQAQSKNIDTILATHIFWSNFLADLANSQYKISQFSSLGLETNGVISVEGIAPGYNEVGKLLLALEQNKDLESVKLLSTTPSGEQQAGIAFSLELRADQSALIEQE